MPRYLSLALLLGLASSLSAGAPVAARAGRCRGDPRQWAARPRARRPPEPSGLRPGAGTASARAMSGPGATGLAHFLEHMMFKGTPTHGKGEFARLVEQNGGQDNAFTTQDVTSYYVDIASDRVDMVLGLEADRMRHLLLDPREIDSERQVVMEERRTRTEDDPDGLLTEEMNSLAFKAHPYRWPIIGWMEDIKRINPAELRAFYDLYYQPEQRPPRRGGRREGARRSSARVRQLFGPIPRGPEPPPVTAVEPPQIDERRAPRQEGGRPASHRGSRLARAELPVRPTRPRSSCSRPSSPRAAPRACTESSSTSGGWRWGREVTTRTSRATPTSSGSMRRRSPGRRRRLSSRRSWRRSSRLKNEPVPDEELERAKNQIEASFVWRQDSVHSRASSLARFELIGSWRIEDRISSRDPCRHRRRSPARGPRLLPHRQEERRRPAGRTNARRRHEVTECARRPGGQRARRGADPESGLA